MLSARMNRLFGESGHCFDVAIDHGMFNQGAFLQGIENMEQAISAIVKADRMPSNFRRAVLAYYKA